MEHAPVSQKRFLPHSYILVKEILTARYLYGRNLTARTEIALGDVSFLVNNLSDCFALRAMTRYLMGDLNTPSWFRE